MRVRHSKEALHGQPPENAFIAYDEDERPVGACSISAQHKPVLYPEQPYRIYIRTEGALQALDTLLGAATARSFMLMREEGKSRARIFTACAPEDSEKMESLKALGFEDDDAMLRLVRVLKPGPVGIPVPRGCTVVMDDLEDEAERRYFLDRFNQVMGQDKDDSFLRNLKARGRIMRLLMVDSQGLVGEMLSQEKEGVAKVIYLFTEPRWRRRKVASHLLEAARLEYLSRGVEQSAMDLCRSQEGAMRAAAYCGYRVDRLLVKFPGITV